MEKKQKRTISALARILGCHESQVQGDIPALGEKGEALFLADGWNFDGDFVTVVSETRLTYTRLPSGRIGDWSFEEWECDETSPHFGEVRKVTGSGQW